MTASAFPEDQTLHGLLEAVAGHQPDRLALLDLESRLTFRELQERSDRLAALLVEKGVERGDVVVLALPRSIETFIGCFAILRAGAVFLPVDLRLPAARNRKHVDAAQARWALISGSAPPECVEHIQAIPVGAAFVPLASPPALLVQGGDDACLIFTSGSTGESKGVRLSHAALVSRSRVEHGTYGFTSADVYLFRASPAFVVLPVSLTILASGVTLAIANDALGDEAAGLVSLMEALRVTFASFPPRLIELLLDRPDLAARLLALRVVRSAGEALSPAVASRFGEVLPRIRLIDGYGTTETSGVIAFADVKGPMAPQGEAPGAMPLEGVGLRVAGPDGREAEEGEVWVATAMLATGYLGGDPVDDPKFIEMAAGSGAPPVRWYRTGDRGRLTPSGGLRILGRMDLQLNLDGVRAEPKEIENALRLHDSVADAAVRTWPDANGRNRLVAYIVDRGVPASAATLRAFVALSLPRTLIPMRLVHIPAIPLTVSGKVDRESLRDPGVSVPSVRSAQGPLETTLLELFREALDMPSLGVDDDFFDWGGDSLKAVALMARIAEATGVRLSAAALLTSPSADSLALVVARGNAREIEAAWLRRDGDLSPLVCLPGIVGDPMWFVPLLQSLDPRRPLLGLSFVGLKDPITIPGAAARALETLKAIQPAGPYFLLGHSLGGVVAFEMARHLLAAGESVAFLGLIDTWVPGVHHPHPSPEAHLLKRVRNRALSAARAKERSSSASAPPPGPRPPASHLPGLRAAARLHRVAPCDLAVTLFRANDRSVGSDLPGDWKPLARGGVAVVDIPGHHFDLVGEGRAKELSARIAEALALSTSGPRDSSSPSS